MQDNVDESFDLTEFQDQFLENGTVRDQLTNLAGNLLSFGTTLLSWLLQAFTIALFTWYLVAEGPETTPQGLLPAAPQPAAGGAPGLEPRHRQDRWLHPQPRASWPSCRRWPTGSHSSIIDIPVPLALALFVGVVSQFIPVVGTYIAGAIPIAIAVADEPINGLWVLLFVIVYQQIENYVFGPRIQARTMEIHVALAFGAVIAGGYILGPIGALLGVPAAATIQAFTSTYLQTYDVVDGVEDRP